MNYNQRFYRFIYDNYYGCGGYEYDNSYSYLIQHSREEDEMFYSRKRYSYLNNIFQPLIDLYIDPIKGCDIDFKTNNIDLNKIINNCNIINFCEEAILNYKLYDKVILEISSSYEIIDGIAVIDKKLYPSLSILNNEYIESIIYNGNEIIEASYLQESIYNNIKFFYSVKYKDNLTIKKANIWIDEDDTITTNDKGEEKRIKYLDEINISYLTKEGYKLNKKPRCFQLAVINNEIFNLESLRNELLNKVAFPILTISSDSELKDMIFGANNILVVPSNVTKMPIYLEPDLTSIDHIKETINEKREFCFKTFTKNLYNDNVTYSSATSSAIASKSFEDEVNNLYTIFKEIFIEIVNKIIEMYEITTSYTVEFSEITISIDIINETKQNLNL